MSCQLQWHQQLSGVTNVIQDWAHQSYAAVWLSYCACNALVSQQCCVDTDSVLHVLQKIMLEVCRAKSHALQTVFGEHSKILRCELATDLLSAPILFA